MNTWNEHEVNQISHNLPPNNDLTLQQIQSQDPLSQYYANQANIPSIQILNQVTIPTANIITNPNQYQTTPEISNEFVDNYFRQNQIQQVPDSSMSKEGINYSKNINIYNYRTN